MQSPTRKRLEDAEMGQFLETARLRNFKSGQTIIAADEIPQTIHYLVEGSVEVVIETENGKELVLAFLNEGHFFGELGFFNGTHDRSAWVRARNDCLVAHLQYDQFRDYATDNPALMFELATQLATRLARTNSRIGGLAFLGVSGRVAQVLMELAEEPEALSIDGGRRLNYTQPQIARIVGCSREMVSRVLKILVADGLVSTEDGIVVWGEFEKRTSAQ